MAKKLISRKVASEKYGIVVSKMQQYNKVKYYLLDNGSVVDSDGDVRYEPIKYGDYGSKSDSALNRMREDLMDYIEKGKSQVFIRKFHELMEVERELTLREDQ